MAGLPHGWTVRSTGYRGASDADLAALHTVETEVDLERRPDRAPQPLGSYIGFARSFPAYFTDWTWLVESAEREPAATAACWYREGDDPQVLECDVMVRRPWRRRGIGTHLVGLVGDVARAEERRIVVAGTHDTVPAGEAFVRRFGARAGRVNRTSELRLADVDWSMVARWVDDGPTRAAGYTLQLVDGVYPDELFDDVVTFHRIMETAPRDDLDVAESEITPAHVAQSDQAWITDAGRRRWTIFVRDPAGGCVGGTEVSFEPWEPAAVLQGDTGIHPDHRGQGLGKWVKAAMLQKVRAELPDAERVRTGNAYSNAPMLAINDALGFKVIQSKTEWQLDPANLRQ